MMMDSCGGGMVLWSLLFLALLLGGIWLIGRAVKGGSPVAEDGSDRPSPRAIAVLEERFARGEIDQEEFEQRRQALDGG